MKNQNRPPAFFHYFIQLLLLHYNYFPALGDLEEEYFYLCKESGITKARNWYRRQVIKSIPYLINHIFYWSITMVKNYFKIALRNLYKNKLYAFINIFGLGVAIAICITGYINFQFSQSFDAFHENKENIYLVNTQRLVNNNQIKLYNSPTLLTPALKKDIPGVDKFTRLARNGAVIRYEEKVFNEALYYIDENFFDIFTFQFLMGNKNALNDKNSIIINDEIAQKYFGNDNPIGKQVLINPTGEKDYVFVVGGIIQKALTSSTLRPAICIHYERQADILGYDLEAWKDWTTAAFILTNEEASIPVIEEQMQNYVTITNEANPNSQVTGFNLTSLPDLSAASRELGNRPFPSGFHLSQIIAPSVIALFVLLLACFNFVNTAIAYSSSRLKEIGIRKVIGGKRDQLVKQFLGENFILCLIALIIGIILAKPFVSFYDGLFPEHHFEINYLDNFGVIGFITGLLVITAITAGSYPALYISRFNPISIFRGKQKFGGTNRLIRVLLTFQFTIAIASILAGVIFYQNSAFIKNFDMGFNKEQILVVPVKGEDKYNLLRNSLINHPDIKSVGASKGMMGRYWTNRDVEIKNETSRIRIFDIGENYMETVDLKLVEGTKFNFDFKSEIEQLVIINETLAKTYDISSTKNQYIKITESNETKEYRVAGVVKDFHLSGLWERVRPMILRASPLENTRYLSLKVDLDHMKNVSEYVQGTWKNLFPHLPYDGFFQTEILAETLDITDAIKLLFYYIALIVIFTSGLGLFALVSLNIVKRTKEIGIRRILGAGFADISYIISKEFLKLLVIAGVVGSVMGYFLVTALLSSIWEYYVDFGLIPVIFSSSLMFVIALLTVGSRLFVVTALNPVESLRYE
jgi:ABC-type antimicrobial peptide transport system permease subunit